MGFIQFCLLLITLVSVKGTYRKCQLAQLRCYNIRNYYISSALFLDFTQRRLVVRYRRFGTIYWSRLYEWRSRKRSLKMGQIGFSKTSVTIELRFVTSEKKRRSYLYRNRILKDVETNQSFKEFATWYLFLRNVG